MNRYRAATSNGNQRASANTTCQKCLKKGHYSYECSSAVQERPYISRPSRTQQLLNPNLKPKLSDTEPNELLRREGIADEQLATHTRRDLDDNQTDSHSRPRRASTASSDSVTTVSTNRSRSRSRSRLQSRRDDNPRAETRRESRSRSWSRSQDLPRKRKRGLSGSSESRSPPRQVKLSDHKSRRFRSISPNARGRTSAPYADSRATRSRTGSIDRSEVAKHRRSLDDTQEFDQRTKSNSGRHGERQDRPRRRQDQYRSSERIHGERRSKQRSLSPYSRRLALTQAMNMDR